MIWAVVARVRAGVMNVFAASEQQCCLQGKHGLLDHLKDNVVEPAPEHMPDGKEHHDGSSAAKTDLSPGASAKQVKSLSYPNASPAPIPTVSVFAMVPGSASSVQYQHCADPSTHGKGSAQSWRCSVQQLDVRGIQTGFTSKRCP